MVQWETNIRQIQLPVGRGGDGSPEVVPIMSHTIFLHSKLILVDSIFFIPEWYFTPPERFSLVNCTAYRGEMPQN